MSSIKDRNALKFASREEYAVSLLRRNPASEDFCTDSLLLGSSKIPTPSPSKKKKTGGVFESKPRRAIGNTRTLKAAWEATADPARPTSSESEADFMPPVLKALPSPARRNTRSDDQGSPEQSQFPPSPALERQGLSTLSSPHEFPSSPPVALEHSYRQIAGEQELTESEWFKEELTDGSLSGDNSSDDRRAQSSPGYTSQSRLSLQGSTDAMSQTAGSNKENQGENTGVTDGTDMSFLNGMTDQNLAAKLTPYALDRTRDRARLDKAIQQPVALVFSKAQVGSKHSLSAENLVLSSRKRGAGSVQSSSNGSARSARTDDVTPPSNVPRTWGSKGRVDKDWLRRIRDRDDSPTAQRSTRDKQDVDSQIKRNSAPAEDVPLPSTDGSSMLQLSGRSRQPTSGSTQSTPLRHSSPNQRNRARQWELNDITGHNLSVSTSPPVKARPRAPDQSRDYEIEVLEKRAVTTNRLGEIVRKNSRERLAVRSRRVSEGAQMWVGGLDSSPLATNAISKINEEGEPIPQTPIVVFRASTTGSNSEDSTDADRKDSIEDLQRLARAISESPRPTSGSTHLSLNGQAEAPPVPAVGDKLVGARGIFRKASEKIAAIRPTPSVRRSWSADAAKTPTVAGAWTDTVLPDTAKTIKQSAAPFGYAQTPHVTGGWIDTPLVLNKGRARSPDPTCQIGSVKQDPSETVEDGAYSKSDTKDVQQLPRSVLSSLLTKAKRKLLISNGGQRSPTTEDEDAERDAESEKKGARENDTLNLGDATIESLEGLLTLDKAEMFTLLRLGEELDAREELRRQEGNGAGNGDSQLVPFAGVGSVPDIEFIGHLGPRLQNICTNIHDVRKGITALERQLQTTAGGVEAGVGADGGDVKIMDVSCQTCGCPGASNGFNDDDNNKNKNRHQSPIPFLSYSLKSSRFYITLPIPRLYYAPRKQLNQHLPRPTLLGYLVLLFWTWYISESILCSWYCHPPFAEWYSWPDNNKDDDGVGNARYGATMSRTDMMMRICRGGDSRSSGGRDARWGITATFTGCLLKHYFTRFIGGNWLVRFGWVFLRTLVRSCAVALGWSDGFFGGGGGGGSDVFGHSAVPGAKFGPGGGGASMDLDSITVTGMGDDELL